MTLGRTASGAIKVKTDDGLRAVNCACCVGGGCACGSATPINPPSDPDFTKKLRGDPGVMPFTQVAVNYSVTVYETASGTMTGTWEDGGSSCPGRKKIFVGQGCTWEPYCGFCSVSENDYPAIGLVGIALLENGCLEVYLIEEYMGEGIKLAGIGDNPLGFDGSTADCTVDDGTGTITINGVSYPTVRQDYFSSPISGTLDITFS